MFKIFPICSETASCLLKRLAPSSSLTLTDVNRFIKLCLNRCYFLVLRTTAIKTCAYRAAYVRDLQDRRSNLVPVSSIFSSISTAFCPMYFLTNNDPVEYAFFNSQHCWWSWNSYTMILTVKPSFTKYFTFHIRILQKSQLFKRVFHGINSVM
jgi:hypothetical protein